MILGPKGVDLNDTLQDAQDWIKETFASIVPWSQSALPDFRVRWVRCFGLPLNFWRKDYFECALVCWGTRSC